jgi:hypothetical protein
MQTCNPGSIAKCGNRLMCCQLVRAQHISGPGWQEQQPQPTYTRTQVRALSSRDTLRTRGQNTGEFRDERYKTPAGVKGILNKNTQQLRAVPRRLVWHDQRSLQKVVQPHYTSAPTPRTKIKVWQLAPPTELHARCVWSSRRHSQPAFSMPSYHISAHTQPPPPLHTVCYASCKQRFESMQQCLAVAMRDQSTPPRCTCHPALYNRDGSPHQQDKCW